MNVVFIALILSMTFAAFVLIFLLSGRALAAGTVSMFLAVVLRRRRNESRCRRRRRRNG
jgi:type IV secretory pathway VirB3-like protein